MNTWIRKLMIAALVLATGSALADIWNVPADYPTIQAAINGAASYDVIEVAPGTYNENVNIDKPVSLMSMGGRDVTQIIGSQAQSVAAGGGNVATLCISSPDVSVEGFTVVGYDVDTPGIEHAAIYLKPGASSGVLILENHIVAAGEGGLLGQYGTPSGGISILFNEFSGKTYAGDTIDGDSSVQWESNNVPRSMIYFGGNTTSIDFSFNTVGGSVGAVIEGTTTTYYNTGATIDCGGATDQSSGAYIDSNIFAVGSWAALRARGPYSTIHFNTFQNTAEGIAGVSVENTDHDGYLFNTFELGAGIDGGYIETLSESDILIEGNIADYSYRNVTGVLVLDWAGGSMGISSVDGTLHYNDGSIPVADALAGASTAISVPADYPTIQAAIDAATAGDTITIAAGTYAENLAVDKALTLLGANAGIDAVTGTRTAETVIQGQVTVTSDDVTIDGCAITNPSGTVGIYAKRCSGLTVANNVIHDINSSGTGSASGIYVLGDNAGTGAIPVSDITITGNHIYAIGSLATTVSVKGIYFGDSNGISTLSNVLVQGNRVENVTTTRGAYGITINYGVYAAGTADTIQILDNIVTNLEGLWVHGIGLETDTANTVVQGNEISDLRDNKTPSDAVGIFFEGNPSGASVVVLENILHSNMGYGLAVHPNDITTYGYTVDASANFWDSTDGPGGEGSGSGAATGPYVDYASFYADSALTQLLYLEVYVDDDFNASTPGWGTTAFATVQEGVDATAPSGVLNVAAGTYAEQVEIDKPLHLVGAGEGQTIIKGFDGMPLFWASSADNYPVVYVHDTSDVIIRNLTVDGDGKGNTNYRYQGIALRNAGGTIEDVTVTGVSDTPFSGAQHGVSIYAYNTDGIDRNIILRRCTIPDFQKNAMALNGVNAIVLVEDCVITGAGQTTVTAQNGIQLWDARGTVRNNSVSDIWWTGGSWAASGILVYDSSDVVVESNTVTDCQAAIYATSYLAEPQNLVVTGNTVTGAEASYIVGYEDVTLEDNTFVQCLLGMNVYNTTQVTLSGNSYADNEVGLWIDGASTNVDITAETFTGNTDTAFVVDPDAANVSIADSIFSGNAQGLINSSAGAVGATRNYWGSEDGPSSSSGSGTGDSVSNNVAYSPWWIDEAMTQLKYSDDPTITGDLVIEQGMVVIVPGAMTVAPGATVTVDGGTLIADSYDLQAGASLVVIDGELELTGQNGQPTVFDGSFTIFDSWGSILFNADTELSGDTVALVSHLVFADGVTLTVSGSLVLDGCVLEGAVDGDTYAVDVTDTATLQMARCEVYDCPLFVVDTSNALVKDNFFADDLVVGPAADGAQVFHNVFADLSGLDDQGVNTVLTADGWGNISTNDPSFNNLGLVLQSADANGDVFIQPGDAVTVAMDLDSLNAPVSGCEALLGFNTRYFDTNNVTVVGGAAPWTFDIFEYQGVADGFYGQIDKAIGVDMTAPVEGTSDDATVVSFDFISTTEEGVTKVFYRPAEAGSLPPDTRLVSAPAGVGTYLSPFTMNSGYITVDGTAPLTSTFIGFQTQGGGDVDVFDPAVLTEQGAVLIGIDATDELSGLAAPTLTLSHQNNASITLTPVLTSSLTNGALAASYSWAVVVDETTSNGVYDVQTIVVDRSGNATTNDATIEVNKTEIEISIELEGTVPAAFNRDVLLVMTDAGGAVVESRLETLEFVNSVGSLSMKQIPVGVAAISADTEWTLRTRQALVFDVDDQATAYLVLKGGDLNGDNQVDMLDFALLRYFLNTTEALADINADGSVNGLDYAILRTNWYMSGDAE